MPPPPPDDAPARAADEEGHSDDGDEEVDEFAGWTIAEHQAEMAALRETHDSVAKAYYEVSVREVDAQLARIAEDTGDARLPPDHLLADHYKTAEDAFHAAAARLAVQRDFELRAVEAAFQGDVALVQSDVAEAIAALPATLAAQLADAERRARADHATSEADVPFMSQLIWTPFGGVAPAGYLLLTDAQLEAEAAQRNGGNGTLSDDMDDDADEYGCGEHTNDVAAGGGHDLDDFGGDDDDSGLLGAEPADLSARARARAQRSAHTSAAAAAAASAVATPPQPRRRPLERAAMRAGQPPVGRRPVKSWRGPCCIHMLPDADIAADLKILAIDE